MKNNFIKQFQDKIALISFLTSPLRGEVDFQYSQIFVNVRKSGEGDTKRHKFFHPHPIFLTLVTSC